jgi:hypothetical protein
MADDKVKDQPKKEETIEDILREAYDETVPKKEEEVKAEEKEEVKEEVPEKDLDEYKEEIKKEAKEEAKAETQDQILKAIGITQEEKDTAESEGWQTPWEKRGENKPKDWQEAVEAGADLADFRKEQAERQAAQEEQVAETVREERRQQLNKYWDEQLTELRAQGKIPDFSDTVKEKLQKGEVLSDEEREDAGLTAQVDLVKRMNEVAADRRTQGKPPIYNLKEIYYEHYDKSTGERAGADAPVSGGRTSVKPAPTGEEELPYEDLHKMDFEQIIRKG